MVRAFSYELKNRIERLKSEHPDPIGFPELFFFRPRVVLVVRGGEAWLEVSGLMEESAAESIVRRILDPGNESPAIATRVLIEPTVSRENYGYNFQKLQEHIARGDIYEVNYCVPFEGIAVSFDPISTYSRLTALSRCRFPDTTGRTTGTCCVPVRSGSCVSAAISCIRNRSKERHAGTATRKQTARYESHWRTIRKNSRKMS